MDLSINKVSVCDSVICHDPCYSCAYGHSEKGTPAEEAGYVCKCHSLPLSMT